MAACHEEEEDDDDEAAAASKEALEAVKPSNKRWEPFPRETPASASTARVSRLAFNERAYFI